MGEPTLLETITSKLRRRYPINVICSNCDSASEIQVPKGIKISEYLNTSGAICSHCGCSGTLEQLKRNIEAKLK